MFSSSSVKCLRSAVTERWSKRAITCSFCFTKPVKTFKISLRLFARLAFRIGKQEIRGIETQLANAEGESREKAKRNFDVFTGLVKQKEQVIARFDHLSVTALRKHFTDDELNTLFRLLNRDLLAMPVGKGGASVSQEGRITCRFARFAGPDTRRSLSGRCRVVPFAKSCEPLAGLENLEIARENWPINPRSSAAKYGCHRTAREVEVNAMPGDAKVEAKGKRLFRSRNIKTQGQRAAPPRQIKND